VEQADVEQELPLVRTAEDPCKDVEGLTKSGGGGGNRRGEEGLAMSFFSFLLWSAKNGIYRLPIYYT
jgi:hypothetical protein